MSKTISMSKKELDRVATLAKLKDRRINNATAAKLMRVSIRHAKRLKKRFEKAGVAGLAHKSRGKAGHNRLPAGLTNKVKEILQEKYPDFKPTLATEKLDEIHSLKISRETVRQIMISTGLWLPKAERLKAHYRSWRDRQEQYGEMEQYDGSSHDWFEGRLPKCVLLLAIDDATGKITHARFAADEGVANTFRFWKEYLNKNGKPLTIYLDRYSTYKVNIGDDKDEPDKMTQFQRAIEGDLNVKIIHAQSPEAKGRVERVFNTLQDRLVKELRLAGIGGMAEANKFLVEEFLPKFNRKFAVPAKKAGDLHRPVTKTELSRLAGILSVQTPRRVNNDFTISLNGVWYQLIEQQPTLVLKKDMVIVEERLDGSVQIRKGKHYLTFVVLPQRPKRTIDLPITGLTPAKQFKWTPPADHPWRSKNWLKQVEALAAKELTPSD